MRFPPSMIPQRSSNWKIEKTLEPARFADGWLNNHLRFEKMFNGTLQGANQDGTE
jgi:hypothetical protein